MLAVAVLGSYARGDATPGSDLDLHAILRASPRVGYRTWFVDGLHVSFGFAEVPAMQRVLARPGDWSLKLPSTIPALWVVADDELRDVFGDPPEFSRPAGEPELEDFVEWCAKALRAADSTALRLAARGAAEEAPALLFELNEVRPVDSRAGALRAACSFRTAPEGWPDDLPVLLGLTTAPDERVRDALVRVAGGVLRLLRESGSRVGDGQPELTRYLHDGTLERHLGLGPAPR
ncbi:MAG TPA: nucleotidyltransferase domain-containing protein [Gaiellaceae bacterium]|nr:nucleotidyltransferase domain-containing protein [Gaiellaceae bacterium]